MALTLGKVRADGLFTEPSIRKAMALVPVSMKHRLLGYILMALIIAFFLVPVASLFFFDCQFFFAPKIASILLIFFR
jgi:hypothetical protein